MQDISFLLKAPSNLKKNPPFSETSLTELLGQPVICLLLVLKISGFECSLLKWNSSEDDNVNSKTINLELNIVLAKSEEDLKFSARRFHSLLYIRLYIKRDIIAALSPWSQSV